MQSQWLENGSNWRACEGVVNKSKSRSCEDLRNKARDEHLLFGVSPVFILLARNSKSVRRPPNVEIQSSSCPSCQHLTWILLNVLMVPRKGLRAFVMAWVSPENDCHLGSPHPRG